MLLFGGANRSTSKWCGLAGSKAVVQSAREILAVLGNPSHKRYTCRSIARRAAAAPGLLSFAWYDGPARYTDESTSTSPRAVPEKCAGGFIEP